MLTQLIQTPVGCLAAEWSDVGLLRSCSFTSEINGQPRAVVDPPNRSLQLLERRLSEYFDTGALTWDLELLDWSGISEFHQTVLRACYRIPAGQTISYGTLAARAGNPKAARAVGGAMAKNRWPIIIPCHRVVGAQGQLTGYSGTGGLATKQQLLSLESQASLLSA
jgi:methylated-DNA-[protein]-cysteine S-methyltransferase